MAINQIVEGLMYAQNAGADLSSALYKLAKIDTDGDIVLAGDGNKVAGAITEPAASGYPVTLQFGGIAKVVLGGTVAAGALVASNASGVGVTATSNEHAFGIALEAGVSSQVISVLISPTLAP